MNRRTALRRTTGLRRRSQLQARTPISPGTAGLQRQARLAPVSGKRRAENRERRDMAERRFQGERPLCAWPFGSSHFADAFHEPLTRARGGSITDEANTVPMCNEHNGMLARLPESELGWAYEAGLLRHSWGAA